MASQRVLQYQVQGILLNDKSQNPNSNIYLQLFVFLNHPSEKNKIIVFKNKYLSMYIKRIKENKTLQKFTFVIKVKNYILNGK